MAYQMVHMEVAYRLILRLGISTFDEQFILGSVAPDSVHMRDPYKVEDKVHTHLFEGCGPWGEPEDYERWMTNIEAFRDNFVRPQTDSKMRMFDLGIYVHCLTDYYNDLLILRRQQKKFMPPMTADELKAALYGEAPLLDKWLFQTSPHSKDIAELLKKSEETGMGDYIYADDLTKMKHHLLNVQYNLSGPIDVSGFKYFPSGILMEFLDTVTEKIYEKVAPICSCPD